MDGIQATARGVRGSYSPNSYVTLGGKVDWSALAAFKDNYTAKASLHTPDNKLAIDYTKVRQDDLKNEGLAGSYSDNGFNVSGGASKQSIGNELINRERFIEGSYDKGRWGLAAHYRENEPSYGETRRTKGLGINYRPKSGANWNFGVNQQKGKPTAFNVGYSKRF